MSISVETMLMEVRGQTREQFIERNPWPFLICEFLTPQESEIKFRTHVLAPQSLSSTVGKLSTRLLTAAANFTIKPVRKLEENLWQDRIIVGRAHNSDIVLRDPSVSKNHATLIRGPENWLLRPKRTVNSTTVAGVLIHDSEEAPVTSRCLITFGNIECEFISAGHLHDALLARP